MKSIVVLVAMLAACGKGGDKPRKGSGAPGVEIINQVSLPDAGPNTTGPTRDEVEPNDGNDVATPLPLGGTMRGKIEPEADIDHYKLDVDQAGSLQVMLSGVDDQDLVLEVQDGTGTVIAKSDRGAVRTKEGVPNLGVTPGHYTVVVRLAPQKKKPKPRVPRGKPPAEIAVAPAPVYELTAQLVPVPPAGEREPNDDRGTANDLLPADTVTGFVGWTADQDVWKLSTEALSGSNVIDVEVSEIDGVALELEIDNGIGDPLLVRKAPRGEAIAVRNVLPQVPPGAPPFHYLVIRGDRSNPETTYRLHTKPHDVEIDAEREPNDTPQHPYAIPSERTRVNGEWTPGDVDCYAIAPSPTARMLDITIDVGPELDLAADMIVDGVTTLRVDHPGRGIAERIGGEVAANTHAVVCVHGGAKAPGKGGGAYTLRVQESGPGDNVQ